MVTSTTATDVPCCAPSPGLALAQILAMDHLPRDVVPDFDSQSFYTIHNSAAPDRTLSAGYKWTNGSVTMGKYTTLSSENWQLYFQEGCYFIRNRDYPSLQLGLTQNDRTVPVLMQKNGSIGQQWGISKTSGGWYFMNRLLGNGSYLALTATNKALAMSPSEQGSVWDIMSNPRCVHANFDVFNPYLYP